MYIPYFEPPPAPGSFAEGLEMEDALQEIQKAVEAWASGPNHDISTIVALMLGPSNARRIKNSNTTTENSQRQWY